MNRLPPCLAALAALPLLTGGCAGDAGDEPTAAPTARTTGLPAAQTVTVGMNDALQFVPGTIEARVGTVTFDVSNLGRVPHDLVFEPASLGKTRTIDGKKAETLTVTFTKAGTFTFVCTLHGGMDGRVVVS